MADDAYPLHVNTEDLDGDDEAVLRQLKDVARANRPRTREFAAWVCRVVGALHCRCDEEPRPLPQLRNRDERMNAARAHPGTCGVWQAEIIARVETQDAEETAAKRGQEPSYRTFRNQVTAAACVVARAWCGLASSTTTQGGHTPFLWCLQQQ